MNYWQKRYKDLQKSLVKDEDKLKRKLSFFYEKEMTSLEKEIASFYQRYGKNNIVTYRDLLKNLSNSEKELLIKHADDFIEKYPKYKDILPVRENIYKLNRLEGLQYSILLQQYKIGAVENEEIRKHLEKYAKRGLKSGFDTLGLGSYFNTISPSVIEKILNNNYAKGSNFSSRIWQNKEKLASYLNTDFAQAIARGDNYNKCVNMITDRFGKVTRNDAYRLIFTEGTYVLNESAIMPFEEDFEEYKISDVGDGKVCNVCRGIIGQVFNIKDRTPGVNFPPFHPWCRCSFEIVVDDWDKWTKDYELKHSGKNGNKIANRLNETAGDSIINKTDEKAIKDYMTSKSYLINEALRNDSELTKEEKSLVNNLDNALKKMPVYKGNLKRSLMFSNKDLLNKFMKDYYIDNRISYKEYISTTKSNIYNLKGQVQIYIINSKRGKDLSSINKAEQEVLYERNSSFEVKYVERKKDKYYILLEESK